MALSRLSIQPRPPINERNTPQFIRLNRPACYPFQGANCRSPFSLPPPRPRRTKPCSSTSLPVASSDLPGNSPSFPTTWSSPGWSCSSKANAKGSAPPRPLKKLEITKQRYFQLLKLYREQGGAGLRGHKPGP